MNFFPLSADSTASCS